MAVITTKELKLTSPSQKAPVTPFMYGLAFVIQMFVIVVCRVLFKIFLNYKVKGRENIKDLPRGVIFALNHVSELDPIILVVALPFLSRFLPMFYVSREKSFYVTSGWRNKIYGGRLFKACGAYPAYVGNHNYEKALVNHIDMLLHNENVCIFPEGRKSKDGVLHEPRGGIGYLSYRTGKPIVPVSLSGIHSMSIKEFFTFKRQLTVTFGKPLYPQDLFDDLNNVAAHIEDHHVCREAAKKVMGNVFQKIIKQ